MATNINLDSLKLAIATGKLQQSSTVARIQYEAFLVTGEVLPPPEASKIDVTPINQDDFDSAILELGYLLYLGFVYAPYNFLMQFPDVPTSKVMYKHGTEFLENLR